MVLASTAIACADEAAAPTEELATSPTSEPGDPPSPVLAPGVQEIGRRTITLAPSPGSSYNLTPEDVQVGEGELPQCDRLVFAFGWLVTDPLEPAPDFGIAWTYTSVDGVAQEVGRGASGTAEVGCGLLTVENETASDVVVTAEYVVGQAP
jgi:hypothetical protein